MMVDQRSQKGLTEGIASFDGVRLQQNRENRLDKTPNVAHLNDRQSRFSCTVSALECVVDVGH